MDPKGFPVPLTPPGVGPEELKARWDGLPEPVRRYLSFAIPKGSPAIRTAHLKHGGTFRLKPDGHWFPIQGEQAFLVGEPGFVWRGEMEPFPFVRIVARDSIQSGRGNMLVKLWSFVTLVDVSGPEMDQGSRLRWLAECMWFPYAYVGGLIRWEPIDDRSARAILDCDGLPASLIAKFDAEGKLEGVEGQRYFSTKGGKSVLTPWTGRARDYRNFDGLMAPSMVEVCWELPEGEFCYARFEVTELKYNTPLPDL